MRKCDSCGKLYQESKEVFCPHCGAVAQKRCTHGSSFDSRRYDRGEIYKNGKPSYQNTTYTYGSEPHAQRKETTYSQPQNTFEKTGTYSDKFPKINIPDLTKTFSSKKGKGDVSKIAGVIIFCAILLLNMVTGLFNDNDYSDFSSDYEFVSENVEDISELYTVVDKATIEIVDTDKSFKTFSIEMTSLGFDDYLPEHIKSDIFSDTMAAEILSENTFVDVQLVSFSKNVVDESSYNNALDDSYYYEGKITGNSCRYEFTYAFDYDEIVHIASGVNFYLDNGLYINAELPFSAFSVSEDGEVTYYTSYADSDTAWNTVFSECSNEQEINRDIIMDFDNNIAVTE